MWRGSGSGGRAFRNWPAVLLLGRPEWQRLSCRVCRGKVRYGDSLASGCRGGNTRVREGSAFGGTAYQTTSTSLLDAFGGLTAGVAYVLQKGLEPMMIDACCLIYSKDRAGNTASRVRDLVLLSSVFAIPSLFGAATGYFLAYGTTYFFALGTGTSIYAALRLAAPLFGPWRLRARGNLSRLQSGY